MHRYDRIILRTISIRFINFINENNKVLILCLPTLLRYILNLNNLASKLIQCFKINYFLIAN